MALCNIGPRQITGWSSAISSAMLMTCRSFTTIGLIFWFEVSGCPLSPSINGTFGP